MTESERLYLDQAFDQVAERLTIEKLMRRLPAIKRIVDTMNVQNEIMHRVAACFQRHQISIERGEDGKTVDGIAFEDAVQDITDTLNLLRVEAIKYQ